MMTNTTCCGIDGTPSRSQDWSLDPLGNWSTLTSDGSDQDRSHNAQNQITSVERLISPLHDGNGNMTWDETGNTLVYDAWNRLKEVLAAGNGMPTIYQ